MYLKDVSHNIYRVTQEIASNQDEVTTHCPHIEWFFRGLRETLKTPTLMIATENHGNVGHAQDPILPPVRPSRDSAEANRTIRVCTLPELQGHFHGPGSCTF
jgi:hypothetical protein